MTSGTVRRLKDKTACLLVRVRGLHLDEKHILCDGEPMAGAIVDFGLYFFHNVHLRLANGTAPYYYVPKLETHLETRLWNDIFKASQDYMNIPQGLMTSGHDQFALDLINRQPSHWMHNHLFFFTHFEAGFH